MLSLRLGGAPVGIDYADQRFYASTYGRFLTPDREGGNSSDPVSMNRYAYVGGDPINRMDPRGTDWFLVGGQWCSTLDPNGGCYDPGYGDPDGGGESSACPTPNSTLEALLESPDGATYAAQLAAMGCGSGSYSAPIVTVAASSAPSGPPCNPHNSALVANNLQFLETNWGAAEAMSTQYLVPADWILGWTALESGLPSPAGLLWGQIAQASNGDNNFLGETGSGWAGQTGCAATVTNSQGSTFACFASFSGSVNAALASKYGAILQAAVGAGESAQQAFTAVYAAGWDKSTAAASGTKIQSLITRHIDPMLDCLAAHGLLP